MDIATQMVDGVNPTRVLTDGFGRIHKSLRLSVTDRCNLRCTYCMPTHDPSYVDRFKLLTFEEMHRVVGLLVGRAGITKVRLTGGEPLLRKELWRLVEMLSQIPGLADLSLTTNAVLLADHAVRLRDAGLQRINISLDTLDPKRFQQLARRDQLHQTLAGIHAAIDAGFESIKLNTLAISGAVENEIIDLARFALDRKLELRFIEFMPLDAAGNWKPGAVLDGEKILRILRTHFYPVQIAEGHRGAAPAERYRVGDGHIGIIRSVTRPFCDACDRLRLSADGAIRNCLFSQDEMSIRDLLRAPATGPTPPPDRIDNAILDAFQHSVSVKRAGHRIGTDDFRAPERPMYSIGG